MNFAEKEHFISQEYLPLVSNLSATQMGKWGKMNAQQMVEHVAGFFDVSSGKLQFALVTPEEHLPKYREFLLSNKEFRENTKAPDNIVPAEPLPLVGSSMEESLQWLNKSIREFFNHFSADPLIITSHPVFGPLNYEDWILLHFKHVLHHSRQFELM